MSSKVTIKREPHQDFGLHLSLQPNRPALVLQIDKNSPASTSGLKPGDSIVSINSSSSFFMRPQDLDFIFASSLALNIKYEKGQVIDLISDDEEEVVIDLAERSGRSLPAALAIDLSSSGEETESLTSSTEHECHSASNNLASSSTSTTLNEVGQKRSAAESVGEQHDDMAAKRRRVKGLVIKEEFPAKVFGKVDEGEELVEIPSANDKLFSAAETLHLKDARQSSAAQPVRNIFEGDLEIIGGSALMGVDMPHQREACVRNSFTFYRTSPVDHSANTKYCAQCYCYVCEVLASDCPLWEIHCNATHKLAFWRDQQRNMREKKKLPFMCMLTPAQIALHDKLCEGEFASLITTTGTKNPGQRGIQFAEAVACKLCIAFEHAGNDGNSFFSLLPVLAQFSKKLHANYQNYLQLVVLRLVISHPCCTDDILNMLKELFSDNAFDFMSLKMFAFYRDPNNLDAIKSLSVLPPSMISMVLKKKYASMTVSSLSAFAAMLPDVASSWSVLAVVAYHMARTSADQLLARHRQTLLSLCSNKSLLEINWSAEHIHRFDWPADVSAEGLLKVAVVLVDLVFPAPEPSSTLCFSFISLLLARILGKLISESVHDANLIAQLATSAHSLAILQKTREDAVLSISQLQYNDDEQLLSALALTAIFIIQIRDYYANNGPILLLDRENANTSYVLSHFFCFSRQIDLLCSEILLDLAVECSNTALSCIEYIFKLPDKVMHQLSALPFMQICDRPGHQRVEVYRTNRLNNGPPDLVLDAQNVAEVIQILFGAPANLELCQVAFGHLLSSKQLRDVLGNASFCFENTLLSVEVMNYLWKSLVILMHKMSLGIGNIYAELFGNGQVPNSTVPESLLLEASNENFIQKHGIESMLLLQTLFVLDLYTVSKPLLFVQEMKRRLDWMMAFWRARDLEARLLSHLYVLDRNDMSTLCIQISRLYYDGLLIAHLDACHPNPSSAVPRNLLILGLVTENWSMCRALQFGSYSSLFEVLGQISASDLDWYGYSLDVNVKQVVSMVQLTQQKFIEELDAIEDIVAELYGRPDNLAYLVYTSLSVRYVLLYASLSRPVLACGLIKGRVEAIETGNLDLVAEIDETIDHMMAQLPQNLDEFRPQAGRLLCLCAYVGSLPVCIEKYSLDLAFLTGLLLDTDDLLCKMICYCPYAVVEQLLGQLIYVLQALPAQDQRYVDRIEASLSSPNDTLKCPDAFRREVLFYHNPNGATLQAVLLTSNQKEDVVNRIYSFLLRTLASSSLDYAAFLDLLQMLGEGKIELFLFTWDIPEALSGDDLESLCTAVLQQLPGITHKHKGLVFLAKALYSPQHQKHGCCDASTIPQEWLLSATTLEMDDASRQHVLAAVVLIWLRKNSKEAVRYVMSLRDVAPAYRGAFDIVYSYLTDLKADNDVGIPMFVALQYYRQHYRELFAYVTSLLFSAATSVEHIVKSLCVAIATLSCVVSRDAFRLSLQDVTLSVVVKDSFLRLCFNCVAKLVRHIELDVESSADEGCWNAVYEALNALSAVILKVSGDSILVEQYLMCALTLLNSFSPSMLTHLPEQTRLALMQCEPADPVGLDPTETLLSVMVRSIAEGGSLRTRLHLLTILLRLERFGNLTQYLHNDLRFSYYQLLVQSLCLSLCHFVDQDTWELKPKVRGIRTTTSDSVTPALLVDIIQQFGMIAVEALELPLLASLSNIDFVELQESELRDLTKLSKNQDAMLFNPHWRLVCSEMAAKSPIRHQYFSAFAQSNDIDKLAVGYNLFRKVREHCGHAFPHFRALIRMLVAVCFDQFDRLAANKKSNKQLQARFANLMLQMCRDSSEEPAGAPFSVADFLSIFQHRKLYDNIVLKGLLPEIPCDAIVSLNTIMDNFTGLLARKYVVYVLENHGVVVDFWRRLLGSATPNHRNNALKCVISTISSVALGIKTIAMKGFKLGNLAMLVNAWIELLAPYRDEYISSIRAEIKAACAVVKQDKSVVAELQRLLQDS